MTIDRRSDPYEGKSNESISQISFPLLDRNRSNDQRASPKRRYRDSQDSQYSKSNDSTSYPNFRNQNKFSIAGSTKDHTKSEDGGYSQSKNTVYNELNELKMDINQRYRGFDRLKRPPVMFWKGIDQDKKPN